MTLTRESICNYGPCGKTFPRTEANRSGKSKFCSPKCWYLSNRNRVTKKCCACGETFERVPYFAQRQKTCGKEECRTTLYRTSKMVPCEVCGKLFSKYRSSKSRACGFKCGRTLIRRQVAVKCKNCGKEFTRGRALVRRVKDSFCNMECNVKFRRGENTYNWRGGKDKRYRGPDWPQQSAQARQRDNFTCQVCGKQQKGEKLSVDHIIPYRLVRRNDLVNLISICRSPCHASKTSGAEADFLRGDLLSFKQRLNENGWPMEKVQAAITWWGAL